MSRLKELYRNEIIPKLSGKFDIKNLMSVPKLEKIIVSVGISEVKDSNKTISSIMDYISLITSQKPVVCLAKKSISNFKIREGMKIGVKVTLRRERMYEFVDRLFNLALPRVRDFRGIDSKSFDGKGNYNMGIKEQLVFPEVEYNKIDKIRGMNICIVTTAKEDGHAKELLTLLGAPFSQ
ncbi:MAG: 50S ribosomal protein L5 [Candidatus Improbicoccus pseudotrichonymphae]|uniref:Large ribosomal subunit protein uL5 n=1 Tax=Candidatus Improbicoccus pseudotrichonymphae TaxID=3033792 RepID=A0AA48L0N2_9FIRM|nr:MAG: 50S ribosomal protein L5 [Candidatus Improbicoccus pseudotrichonymphae]